VKVSIRSVVRVMPNLWNSRDLLLYFVGLVFFIILVVVGFGKLGMEYSEAQSVKNEIVTKTAFIQEWKSKQAELERVPNRPATMGDVEQLQEMMLHSLAANHLNLVSFNNVNWDAAKDNGLEFEVTFTGAWESTMMFVENFKLNDVLLSVRSLKLDMDETGKIRTVMRYKIYLK